jgi:hypothetical protein
VTHCQRCESLSATVELVCSQRDQLRAERDALRARVDAMRAELRAWARLADPGRALMAGVNQMHHEEICPWCFGGPVVVACPRCCTPPAT